MNTRSKWAGIALATAAAGLFATASVAPAFAGEEGTVKCENSSACKGHGACKTASNECKGHNACKGQGMTMQESDEACKAAQEAAKSG